MAGTTDHRWNRALRARGRGALRLGGLTVMVALVALGIAVSSAAFRWRAGKLVPEVEIEAAGPDSSPEARVRYWFEKYGRAQIHHALVSARFSPGRDWLVTHVDQPVPVPGETYEPELWGIDLAGLAPDISRCEGVRVVVRVPAPRMLARTADISGAQARQLPIYRPGDTLPALEELARARVQGYLSPIATALARKLPEARIAIEVATEAPVESTVEPVVEEDERR